MQKRTVTLFGFILLGACLMVSVAANEQPPVFFFGGEQVHVGMSQQQAVTALSRCCKLSPPMESGVEKRPVPEGQMLGHMILPKEEPPQRILGAIYFSGEKVARVTRPLAEEVDAYNDDVVGFARAIKRFLAAKGDTETTATVAVRHERISNAESDVVLITLKDGRGIEIHIGTFDKPNEPTDKRDFVTLDGTLER